MASYFAKRLGISVLLLFVVSIVTFVLVSLSPGNAAYTLLGPYATGEQLQKVEEQLHLNDPLLVQYWRWLSGAFHGDFGTSLINSESVTHIVGARIGPTLSLILLTLLVTGILGIIVGIAGALRGGWVARTIDIVGLIGVAIPGFVIGLVLIAIFAVRLRLLPAVGYHTLSNGPGPWISALILPVISLLIGSVGLVAKQVRAAMSDVLSSEFVRTLTANGFRHRSIVYKHALRSAAIPVLAVMGVTVVGMLGASVIIEQVFGIPGIGGLAVQRTISKDLPVIQFTAVVYTLIVIVVNLVLDVAYVLVNPKVKMK